MARLAQTHETAGNVTETAGKGPQTAQRRARTPIPENETPRDRFLRVAGGRATLVLTGLRTLGQMGNSPTQYEYTEEDVKKLVARVVKAMNDAVAALNAKGVRTARKAADIFD